MGMLKRFINKRGFDRIMNKRGQGLTTGTLVLIILGLVVLVLLVLALMGGTDFLAGIFEKVSD